jgi:hypothetical protein
MKCEKHKKDHVGGCQWCGKRVCEFCVAKQVGKKLYCEKCASMLGGIQKPHLPKVGREPMPPQGRRFVMKDGFLVMEE